MNTGQDTNTFLRKQERREVRGFRCLNARACFEALRNVKNGMPQPAERNLQNCAIQSYTSRSHLFLTDISESQPGDAKDPDIIIVDKKSDSWDTQATPGIASVYSTRADSMHQDNMVKDRKGNLPGDCVYFKSFPCNCPACRDDPRSMHCPFLNITGPWVQRKLTAIRGAACENDDGLDDSNGDENDDIVVRTAETIPVRVSGVPGVVIDIDANSVLLPDDDADDHDVDDVLDVTE